MSRPRPLFEDPYYDDDGVLIDEDDVLDFDEEEYYSNRDAADYQYEEL